MRTFNKKVYRFQILEVLEKADFTCKNAQGLVTSSSAGAQFLTTLGRGYKWAPIDWRFYVYLYLYLEIQIDKESSIYGI